MLHIIRKFSKTLFAKILIVIIIGVTLLLEIVEIKKHKDYTVIITIFDRIKANKNRQITSFSDKNNNPL